MALRLDPEAEQDKGLLIEILHDLTLAALLPVLQVPGLSVILVLYRDQGTATYYIGNGTARVTWVTVNNLDTRAI